MTFSLYLAKSWSKSNFLNYLHVTVLQFFSFHLNDSGKPLLCIKVHNCVHIGQSTMCFSEMPFHPERLQTTKAFLSPFQLSCQVILNMYHHCNFVHDKVFCRIWSFSWSKYYSVYWLKKRPIHFCKYFIS